MNRRLLSYVVIVFVLISICALILSSCKLPMPPQDDLSVSVRRYEDKEAAVVCWIFKSGYTGGIDCMPMAETSLEKK